MSLSTRKGIPVTTLVNLRLWQGQMEQLESLAAHSELTFDEMASMIISKGLTDIELDQIPASIQDIEEPEDTLQEEPNQRPAKLFF